MKFLLGFVIGAVLSGYTVDKAIRAHYRFIYRHKAAEEQKSAQAGWNAYRACMNIKGQEVSK